MAIISWLKLSPSQFADEIGIQRSGMSHLVSGRNNPSLEFIQKTISRFPEINPEWLLTGSGSMTKQANAEPPLVTNNELPFEVLTGTELPDTSKIKRKKSPDPEGRQVERIVYFYRDKTFREYMPE